MASFHVFFSTFFFFLLPHISSAAVICQTSSCDGSLPVNFPFRLKGYQNRSCGYPGFDLSCNNQSQTILTLPYSGDVVVYLIDYYEQSIYIADPDHCFARRFLENFTLSSSPFQYFLAVENFTFYELLRQRDDDVWPYARAIRCVSGDAYRIWITPSPTGISMTPPPSCSGDIGGFASCVITVGVRHG
jgi:hypothetical protein